MFNAFKAPAASGFPVCDNNQPAFVPFCAPKVDAVKEIKAAPQAPVASAICAFAPSAPSAPFTDNCGFPFAQVKEAKAISAAPAVKAIGDNDNGCKAVIPKIPNIADLQCNVRVDQPYVSPSNPGYVNGCKPAENKNCFFPCADSSFPSCDFIGPILPSNGC